MVWSSSSFPSSCRLIFRDHPVASIAFRSALLARDYLWPVVFRSSGSQRLVSSRDGNLYARWRPREGRWNPLTENWYNYRRTARNVSIRTMRRAWHITDIWRLWPIDDCCTYVCMNVRTYDGNIFKSLLALCPACVCVVRASNDRSRSAVSILNYER